MPPRGNFLTESSLPRYTLGCVSSWGWGWLLTASLTLEGPVTCYADRHPHPNTQDPLLEQGGPLCIPGEGQGPWPGLGSLPDRGLPQRTSLVPLPPANRPPPPACIAATPSLEASVETSCYTWRNRGQKSPRAT